MTFIWWFDLFPKLEKSGMCEMSKKTFEESGRVWSKSKREREERDRWRKIKIKRKSSSKAGREQKWGHICRMEYNFLWNGEKT